MEKSNVRFPVRWEKVVKGRIKEPVKQEEIIPVEPSNTSYTLVNTVVLAIGKARDLKRTLDLEVSFLDRLSTNAIQLDAVSGVLCGVMLRLAKLGYGVSRELKDYNYRTLDYFVGVYSNDLRDIFEYPRKRPKEISDMYTKVISLVNTIGLLYSESTRVQPEVVDELTAIKLNLLRGENLLNIVL